MKDPKTALVKVNLPGGVVPVGNFTDILTAAEKAGVEEISLGNRQNLYLIANEHKLEDLQHQLDIADIDSDRDEDEYPNIVSSYISDEIFTTSNWLREGVYKDILDSFDYKPRLQINITDQTQSLVPFFTGNLNYISSDISNFWYLYIRLPNSSLLSCWSSLIYSEDIVHLSKKIEATILRNQYDLNTDILESKVRSEIAFVSQPIDSNLKIPKFQLPCYEGFNNHNHNYWLGIFRKDERYRVTFLKDLCTACSKARIGTIYISPWKSILVKGIEEQHREVFDLVINRHRLNVRHGAVELNWQVEDNSSYGLTLKHYLVKQLDKSDCGTDRLCFAITTGDKADSCASIIIKTQTSPAGNREPGECFELLHTKDFNPNSNQLITYRKNVQFGDLSKTLTTLIDLYYYQADDSFWSTATQPLEEKEYITCEYIYQCKHCLSVYDEASGDEINKIEPGTAFPEIGDSYACPICESPKKDFILIEKKSLVHI